MCCCFRHKFRFIEDVYTICTHQIFRHLKMAALILSWTSGLQMSTDVPSMWSSVCSSETYISVRRKWWGHTVTWPQDWSAHVVFIFVFVLFHFTAGERGYPARLFTSSTCGSNLWYLTIVPASRFISGYPGKTCCGYLGALLQYFKAGSCRLGLTDIKQESCLSFLLQ